MGEQGRRDLNWRPGDHDCEYSGVLQASHVWKDAYYVIDFLGAGLWRARCVLPTEVRDIHEGCLARCIDACNNG